jgi:lysozyme
MLKSKKSARAQVILIGTVVTGSLLGLYFGGRAYPTQWAASRYPVHGIDISHHQGAVDWKALTAEHVGFAYMKATEGADYRDSTFASNWRRAERAEIPRGAYHFYSLGEPGAAQARNFIAAVPPQGRTLPPAVDLEYGDNDGERPSFAALQTELGVLLSRLRSAYHREPVIYTTGDFYSHYLANYPVKRLWIRNTLREPAGSQRWLFWQSRQKRPRHARRIIVV